MDTLPGGGINREYAGGKMLAAKDDGVGLITFNQPEKRNAMSMEMWAGLGEIFDEFAEDGSVRVVILSGAGHKAFVSGADISQFEKNRSNADAQQEYDRQTSIGRAKFAAFPKPVMLIAEATTSASPITGECILVAMPRCCTCGSANT